MTFESLQITVSHMAFLILTSVPAAVPNATEYLGALFQLRIKGLIYVSISGT